MDLNLESSEDVSSVSQLEHNVSSLKLQTHQSKYDSLNRNALNHTDSGLESDLDSCKLSNIFINGVNNSNYLQFCDLFSKVLYKQSEQTDLGPENHDHSSDLSKELDVDKFDLDDFDESYGDELETVYWDCLEWFINVLDELNRFESLGFGISFLINSLKRFTYNYSISKDNKIIENVEKIKKLIDFINIFRDANNSIYTTYALLDRMETKLNHVRYKSIKILQLKLNNKSKFINSNPGVTSPISSPFDQFDNTPINTPSSTTTSLSDRGEMDLLYEIWDSKLCKLRLLVFKKFRYYIINVVKQLKDNYYNFNYYQLVQFIVYTNNNNNNKENTKEDEENTLEDEDNKEKKEDKETENESDDRDNIKENNEEMKEDNNKKEDNDMELMEEYDEEEDILEYLNKYYSVRNMNEEKADSYVSRIRDLNSRLIPKFVKIITRLPIYYEAFLNALICNNIQDGMFQLISSNGNVNYKDLYREFYREYNTDTYKDRETKEYYIDKYKHNNNNNKENNDNKYNNTNNNNKENKQNKEDNKEVMGLRDEKEMYRDDRVEYKSCIQKIDVVRMLNRTNLEVVDAVRCSFNNSRKLVVFSQGSLKDMFNSFGSYSNKDLYKEMYRETYRDYYKDNNNYNNNNNNKETKENKYNNNTNNNYYRNNNANNRYNNNNNNKEYYRDMYRDNIIIKSENKDGSFSKMERDDDEILKRIYYCNNNLSEVASGEVERVIIQHMPAFSWSPKLVKHQLNLETRQSNYDYNMNQELFGNDSIDSLGILESSGMEYIEYIKLEEKIWMNRLNMFNKINERNIRKYLMKRNNNNINKIKYESSNLLLNNKIPFMVLLDYNNYIPIKYIYNENNNNKENNINNNTNNNNNNKQNKEKEKKEDVDDKDWLMRIFNDNSNNRIFKSSCIDIEIERDLFPGFFLFNNYKLNCFILPIHENNFQSQETFVNFSKMVQNKIDLVYPSYLQQINHFILSSMYNNNNKENTKEEYTNNKENEKKNKFTGKYGDYFVTYHTNLAIGNKDKMVINFVFHLVCCDTSMNDDISPIEYAEDTEVILKHIKKIQPVLDGLRDILKVCNKLKVQTIHLPASLKCCYKMNQHNSNVIQAEFYQNSSYNIMNSMGINSSNMNNNTNNNKQNNKESVIECNNDYVRCLAVVSYLASLLNKNKYSIKNINLIFPQHLNQTLLPKTAVNIFTTRVNTF